MLYTLCLFVIAIALLVDNIKLRKRIRVDAVTKSVTRDVFEDTLFRWNKTKSKFAIVYIDCDRFKAINDEYGHKVGDHVLFAVAEFLKEIVRPYDIVA
jgi:diguanylate cyclase (GGDEF)-like protein